MTEPLPKFRFHPDPVLSGAVEAADEVCGACERATGFVYTGPCYVEDDFDAALCPWCIADGRAFHRFGVTFAEIAPGPGFDLRTAEEIEERTPGIRSEGPIAWPACCGKPMAYLEPAGHGELAARHARLLAALPAQIAKEQGLPAVDAAALCARLQRDALPTAHVFGCARCRVESAVLDLP